MKLRLSSIYCLALGILFLSASCEKEYESIEEIDSREVQSYLQTNKLTAEFQEYESTGIYYKILSPGSGDGQDLEYTDKIYATFTAKSLDGRFSMQADSLNRFTSFLGYFSRDNGYPEAFGLAIKEVLKKKGGSIRLIIPSHQAYGRTGNSTLDIPGNSSLDCIINVYDADNQTEFEDIFVKRYFASNKLDITTFSKTATGLYYKVENPGAVEKVNEGSLITTKYVGKLTNGTIFDQSDSYQSYLYLLIPGWQQGLVNIGKGGKIRLIVPPSLGYGSSATGSIPPYSTLDFSIEVLDVD